MEIRSESQKSHVDHGWPCTDDIDTLVAAITRTLTNPGNPAHAVDTLNYADTLFGRLDLLLRRGHSLPSGWRVAPDAHVRAHDDVDTLYDLVSESLREMGGPPVCWKALRDAGPAWSTLVEALREGSPLLGPWSRD